MKWKLILCNAHIHFNKTCLKETTIPKYTKLNNKIHDNKKAETKSKSTNNSNKKINKNTIPKETNQWTIIMYSISTQKVVLMKINTSENTTQHDTTIKYLILFGIRKSCLISGRSLLLYQFTRRVIKPTVVIIMRYHCYQLHKNFIQYSSLKIKSIYIYIYEIIGDQQCMFWRNTSFAFVRYWRKNGSTMRQYISHS
jgi:hypothetical protein